jgi:hypothetical protein
VSSRISGHLRGNVVGYVALFIALSGTVYAAEKIDSKDIRAGAVKSKQVANDGIKSKDLRDGRAVKSRDVKDGSLGGSDIDEASLGTVPRAATADSADLAADADTVGGVSITPFSFTRPSDLFGTETVIERDGVKVTYNCGAGDISLRAYPISDGTRVRLIRIPLNFDLSETDQMAKTAESSDANDSVQLALGGGDGDHYAAGSLSVLTPSGRVTVIDYDARRGNEGQGIPCRFWGQIRSGQS